MSETRPLFSICHTTARPEGWQNAYHAWLDRAKHRDQIEYILAVDARWGFTELPKLPGHKTVWNTGRRCWVGGANVAAAHSTGQVIIISADDMFPPEGWDELLWDAIGDYSPSGGRLGVDFAVHVATTADANNTMVLPIISRARYERLGYALYPEYDSVYADDECGEHARADGVCIQARNIVVEHRHPRVTTAAKWDEVYVHQYRASSATKGEAILSARRAAGFPVKERKTAAKVILFSPVRQDAQTLPLAVDSHSALNGIAKRWYYDDNDSGDSSYLLRMLKGCRVLGPIEVEKPVYDTSGETHAWSNQLVSRIAKIRNHAIQEFLKTDADALFIVDSDIVVHPGLVEHLLSLDLPIVSEVFWSKWKPQESWMPNVWDGHGYAFTSPESITLLREHGLFEVGGLGACTLIRREVLERGVRYEPIAGVNFWGEDRWFSIRAAANGFRLHADTCFPPFHVYRQEQLDEARTWLECGCPPHYFRNTWLTDEWAEEIRKSMSPSRSLGKKGVIACVLPGEVFSQAWVGAWTNILGYLFEQYHVCTEFGSSSIVYFTRQTMFDALHTITPKPDLILWIDDDQVLTVDALKLLEKDLEDNPDLDMVFGWAWCEQNSYGGAPMLSCGIFNREGKSERLRPAEMEAMAEDLIPISYSGFPAVLMRGSILDRIGSRAFMPIFDEEQYPPYGMSGEDVAFTVHAREAGLKLAVDRRVKVPHLKLRCAEPVGNVSSLEGAPVELKEN